MTLDNGDDRIAFFVELLVVDQAGQPVVPVLWQDNFASLLPNERGTLSARYPASAQGRTLIVRGWNSPERSYPL